MPLKNIQIGSGTNPTSYLMVCGSSVSWRLNGQRVKLTTFLPAFSAEVKHECNCTSSRLICSHDADVAY